MANVTPQIPNKSNEVKNGAAAANSVPDIRVEVVKLAEEVGRLAALVEDLTRPRQKA